MLYMKNLEETVSYIVSNCRNVSANQAQDVQLLQDIRSYFADSSSCSQSSIPPLLLPSHLPSHTQQANQQNGSFMNDMFGVMSLDDEEAAEQRRRHFSSISDGSSSSDSSNNVTNYQQFENILQRIFKFTQMAGGGECSPTGGGVGEKRQVESRKS